MTAAKIGSRVGWRECWVVAALAAYALARLSPPIENLSPQGQAVLGAMAAGAMLWISEATPIGVTAIVVTVLLALSPGARLADAVGGFASEVVFFLIGAVAIGTAVEVSWPRRARCPLPRPHSARQPGAALCADDRQPSRFRGAGAVGDHAQRHSDSGLHGGARPHGHRQGRSQRTDAHAGARRAQSAGVVGAAHRRTGLDHRGFAARRLFLAALVRADGGAVLRVAVRRRAVAALRGRDRSSRRRTRQRHRRPRRNRSPQSRSRHLQFWPGPWRYG